MGERDVHDIIRRLEREGWYKDGGKGSDRLYKKHGISNISIPSSDKELKAGTYRNVAKKPDG